jgi:hypothetical protein
MHWVIGCQGDPVCKGSAGTEENPRPGDWHAQPRDLQTDGFQAKLRVSVELRPSENSSQEQLPAMDVAVRVLSAERLPPVERGWGCNPLVRGESAGQVCVTPVRRGTRNPVWGRAGEGVELLFKGLARSEQVGLPPSPLTAAHGSMRESEVRTSKPSSRLSPSTPVITRPGQLGAQTFHLSALYLPLRV